MPVSLAEADTGFPMNIVQATRSYERWLGKQIPLLKPDLREKHRKMAEAIYPFLRATFYRWMELWPATCPDLVRAPRVLAVGDLHVENFGTWRDVEGRLIWGVNDFDEAFPLPYTVDLVRLATSAVLARKEQHFSIKTKSACDALLEGYGDSLQQGGEPFVLAERNRWLRRIAENRLRDPVAFWGRLDALPSVTRIPEAARRTIEHLLPASGIKLRYARRVAGLGSLGRQRYVALADWHGGRIAREVKGIVPSASLWAGFGSGRPQILYQTLITRSVRCPDPFVHAHRGWVARRLSPHCARIELQDLPARWDELRLLYAMGWETANLHLGSPGACERVQKDLSRRNPRWLLAAVRSMVRGVEKDWERWRK
jgi:hypothetical protein